MRQLGDLLAWVAMIGVLVAVIYLTPMFAQYMSSENQPTQRAGSDRNLALHVTRSSERTE